MISERWGMEDTSIDAEDHSEELSSGRSSPTRRKLMSSFLNVHSSYRANVQCQLQQQPPPTVSSWLPTIEPTTFCSHATRLISDIDDTINYTNVTGGAQPAFYNAFVRDLQEVTIPATSEWYPELEGKNVGYSYVSNISFQHLPSSVIVSKLQTFPMNLSDSAQTRPSTSFSISSLGFFSWSSPFAGLTGAHLGASADAALTEERTNKENDWAAKKKSGGAGDVRCAPARASLFFCKTVTGADVGAATNPTNLNGAAASLQQYAGIRRTGDMTATLEEAGGEAHSEIIRSCLESNRCGRGLDLSFSEPSYSFRRSLAVDFSGRDGRATKSLRSAPPSPNFNLDDPAPPRSSFPSRQRNIPAPLKSIYGTYPSKGAPNAKTADVDRIGFHFNRNLHQSHLRRPIMQTTLVVRTAPVIVMGLVMGGITLVVIVLVISG
ncbi:hypothetical protein GYMLUDRAFT_243168 [Collybiopsis luxurians FD-317 M1]|uniref:Phosphatidate phosphatase APP1 catalytic domain-containing protein n=1 Tax=Collybiopsis luxurians FD-317 M1 TaxID=944289 RepID=A0A0D0CHB6_9AGAR|nr:hypothetical protein GYMLUDRAFT_243168 [Collybiopsis luxurians FD-317 M1]